ncbi:MAG: hypothetical protein AAF752_15860, partial [Bacteroidota bacterium]
MSSVLWSSKASVWASPRRNIPFWERRTSRQPSLSAAAGRFQMLEAEVQRQVERARGRQRQEVLATD